MSRDMLILSSDIVDKPHGSLVSPFIHTHRGGTSHECDSQPPPADTSETGHAGGWPRASHQTQSWSYLIPTMHKRIRKFAVAPYLSDCVMLLLCHTRRVSHDRQCAFSTD